MRANGISGPGPASSKLDSIKEESLEISSIFSKMKEDATMHGAEFELLRKGQNDSIGSV
jgi:hypothetical protein